MTDFERNQCDGCFYNEQEKLTLHCQATRMEWELNEIKRLMAKDVFPEAIGKRVAKIIKDKPCDCYIHIDSEGKITMHQIAKNN